MLILASASPRRQELLAYITTDFAVVTLPTDESVSPQLAPRQAVEELALRKATAVFNKHPEDTVIGADTMVTLNGTTFGKPADAADAAAMLHALSGKEHVVLTGVAVLTPNGAQVFSAETAVRFRPLTAREISEYVNTGEPMDKAGAYGIQGKGALLVEGISGDFYNVMGLPVCKLHEILQNQ